MPDFVHNVLSQVKPFRSLCTIDVRYEAEMLEPKHRLQAARAKKFASPTEAAKAIREINKNTLISNENGNRKISRKMAEVYAKHFEVSAGWLLYGEQGSSSGNSPYIPLVSWVSAGRLSQTVTVEDIDELPSIYMPDLDPSGDWIALRVDGRSMDKVSPHDSIIFVNRNDKTLVDRGLYVFLTSEGEATYKRFVYPDKLEALTTKPEQYKDIKYDPTNPPEVIGRVKKSTIDL